MINFDECFLRNILGIVENMSGFICPHCQKTSEIFSHGGGASLAKDYDLELLGRIPLDPQICALGDAGEPIVAAKPDHPISQIYQSIAKRMAAKISTINMAPAPQIIQS